MLINFNGSFSNNNKDLFKEAQEEDLIKIVNYLKTPLKDIEIIKLEVFDTAKGKQKKDPHHSVSRASAGFKEMTVYRYWEPNDDPHFPHELTHLVAHTWGKPYLFKVKLDTAQGAEIEQEIEMISTSFMQEGLAIAVDEIVFHRKLFEIDGEEKYPDEWCEKNINKIPKLQECINFDGFNSFENKIIVPFSGSLAKFLLINYGLKKFKKMYVETKETNPRQINIEIIEKIYAISEDELLKTWRKSLSLKKS